MMPASSQEERQKLSNLGYLDNLYRSLHVYFPEFVKSFFGHAHNGICRRTDCRIRYQNVDFPIFLNKNNSVRDELS